MKLILNINKENIEEKVEITAKETNSKIEQITKICNSTEEHILGYTDDGFKILNEDDIYYFNIDDRRIYANTKNEKYLIKKRLYEIEELLGNSFIKISQSAIINIKFVLKFELSFNGTITCIFKNNNREYVSRRFVPLLKKKLGI